MSFWEALTFKQKKDGAWRPVRLGYAREGKKGGYDIFLDAMPAPNEHGYYKLTIQPPRDQQPEQQAQQERPAARNDFDDDIPY